MGFSQTHDIHCPPPMVPASLESMVFCVSLFSVSHPPLSCPPSLLPLDLFSLACTLYVRRAGRVRKPRIYGSRFPDHVARDRRSPAPVASSSMLHNLLCHRTRECTHIGRRRSTHARSWLESPSSSPRPLRSDCIRTATSPALVTSSRSFPLILLVLFFFLFLVCLLPCTSLLCLPFSGGALSRLETPNSFRLSVAVSILFSLAPSLTFPSLFFHSTATSFVASPERSGTNAGTRT